MKLNQKIEESTEYIRKYLGASFPDTLVILGSGFKAFSEAVKPRKILNLSDVPHMPIPRVEGHGATLIIAEVGTKIVAIQTGRVHLYEGHSAAAVVFSLRVFNRLGSRNLLITNASGGLKSSLVPGQVLAISDQINMSGNNCLTGEEVLPDCQRFVDMNNCYDAATRQRIIGKTRIKSGVYVAVLGPTYETPSETAYYGTMGDVIGMSTVQEVIAARQLGMKVAGLSLVTNLASGLSASVNHAEVIKLANDKKSYLQDLIRDCIEVM